MMSSGPVSHGVKAGIAAIAVALTATSTRVNNGVYVQALSGNSAPVYVGITGVTTANGFPVAAGTTSPLIPCDDPSKLYVISSGGTQEVRWIGS